MNKVCEIGHDIAFPAHASVGEAVWSPLLQPEIVSFLHHGSHSVSGRLGSVTSGKRLKGKKKKWHVED